MDSNGYDSSCKGEGTKEPVVKLPVFSLNIKRHLSVTGFFVTTKSH